MSKKTTEKAFEDYAEEVLLSKSGWQQGDKSEWHKEFALFPNRIFDFLQSTQKELWQQMEKLHGDGLKEMLIKALVKELEIKGSLNVLRHGFKFYGKTFRLANFKPAHGLAPDVEKLYKQNQLTVTRQIPCHPNDNSTVDMLLALNGIPLATIEIKNRQTGQNWQHAVKQYREDRNPAAPLFVFKQRSLVHFAIDSEEVYMTTRLNKEKTFFLPLNRGSDPGNVKCGAGNPPHASGHRTGYFWEEILQRDSFLEIIGQFMFVEKKEEKIDDGKGGSKRVTKETMIFPRYHQLDAVKKLIDQSQKDGAGNNYLIQHSAGSGKTNSISWLSHRLASLHDAKDNKIFDAVIVITDRQVLDSQLQDAVYQIEHAQGLVKAIDENSRQLADALVDGTAIVVTTLQKFPFVLRGLLRVAGASNIDDADEETRKTAKEWETLIAARKYAVIVDEAHSSQSGESARELKQILGAAEVLDAEDGLDGESTLNEVIASRGKQPNVSFYAFTATPKGKTLELFGKLGADGKPVPFHVYSMRQAIEEKFIKDVLKHYTTYKVYYNLIKKVEGDPSLPKRKGSQALAKFMQLHPHNISQKIEVIVEHFRNNVQHLLGGRAKAMVVTESRQAAVKYRLEFDRYINEKGYKIRALVAFSGKVTLDQNDSDYRGEGNSEFTEAKMNIDWNTGASISERQLPERFASNDYQVLLVANKYQTGFDQPLLMAMYVDKRLDNVQAVQTLSRLNRTMPGKDDPFVLDFRNEAEDIKKAFKPYFDATMLHEQTDPDQLGKLKQELDDLQIYYLQEIEQFAKVFYKIPDKQRKKDHAELRKAVEPAKQRFEELDDEDDKKIRFYDRLSAFVKIYSFVSQITPWPDVEHEKLYSFGHYLMPLLSNSKLTGKVELNEDVALDYYRLRRTSSGAINLKDGDDVTVKSPSAVGTRQTNEIDALLSELITTLNDTFGTEFTEDERYFAQQFCERAAKDERTIKTAEANPFDKFQIGIKDLMPEFMLESMKDNDKFVTKYMGNDSFQATAFPLLAKLIYDMIAKEKNEEKPS